MNTVTSRLSRAKDRMTVWLELLPKGAQNHALFAIEDLVLVAEQEIEQAYGDGYRMARDEAKIAKHAKELKASEGKP